jgi:hypothetical protein
MLLNQQRLKSGTQFKLDLDGPNIRPNATRQGFR